MHPHLTRLTMTVAAAALGTASLVACSDDNDAAGRDTSPTTGATPTAGVTDTTTSPGTTPTGTTAPTTPAAAGTPPEACTTGLPALAAGPDAPAEVTVPRLQAADEAWVCVFSAEAGSEERPWSPLGEPVALDGTQRTALFKRLRKVTAQPANQPCTMDIGPVHGLFWEQDGEPRALMVEDFGCQNAWYSEDLSKPFSYPPLRTVRGFRRALVRAAAVS